MTLQELRRARNVTQVRIAKELEIRQEGVSRLEKRSDLLLSTLRKTVKAMGGDLRLIVAFPDREPVVLSGTTEETGTDTKKAFSSVTKERQLLSDFPPGSLSGLLGGQRTAAGIAACPIRAGYRASYFGLWRSIVALSWLEGASVSAYALDTSGRIIKSMSLSDILQKFGPFISGSLGFTGIILTLIIQRVRQNSQYAREDERTERELLRTKAEELLFTLKEMLDVAREEIARNISIFDDKTGQRPARRAAQKCEILVRYYFPFLLANELSPTAILDKWNRQWSDLDKRAAGGQIRTPQLLLNERKKLLEEAETTSSRFQEQFLKMDLYQMKRAWLEKQEKARS